MAENERYDIAYLEDIEGVVTAPSSVVQGNIAVFGEAGDHASLQDSGKKLSDYVAKTELPGEVDSATEEIWDAVKGVYAISAYNAPAWEPEHAYAEGDFCKVGGIGYRCTQNHTSSDDFDDDKDESWEVVLTASGKLAIDAMLRVYSNDGLAKLSSLAPAMVEGSSYSKDQLVVIDGDLYICTTGGIGGSTARFRKATVEESIVNRIQALSDTLSAHTSNTSIHVSAADRTAWNDKQDAISDIATIRENAAAGAAAAGRDKVVIDTDAGNSVSAVKADGSVSVELAPKSSIPTDLGQLSNNPRYLKQVALDLAYDTSEGEYAIGDTCTHEGKFYKCVRRVLQDSNWDADDWQETSLRELVASGVLQIRANWDEDDPDSPAFIQNKPNIPESFEIDDTLSIRGAAADALATGDAVATRFRSSAVDSAYDTSLSGYSVGDTCTRNGRMYKCVADVAQGASWSSQAWEEISIKELVDETAVQPDWDETDPDSPAFIQNKPDIPEPTEIDDTLSVQGAAADALATGNAVAARLKSSAVDSEYDTSSTGYSVGDTCTHDGEWYRCIAAVAQGAQWSSSSWTKITIGEVVSGLSDRVQANWSESDTTSPAYIQNKPTIPTQVVIDATLSHQGEAADAKAVGDAISQMVSEEELPYKVEKILSESEDDDLSDMDFRLLDRTVNIIDNVTINNNRVIRLILPSSSGSGTSRDFYVVLHVNSAIIYQIPVNFSGASLEDYAGENVKLYALAGEWVTYRFTETSTSGNVFLVSGFGDPTYRKIREIEQALDDLLADGGAASFVPGIFIPDASGKFHKLIAVTDPETGEVDIGVEQEGVEK